jgi:hypothetical protein
VPALNRLSFRLHTWLRKNPRADLSRGSPNKTPVASDRDPLKRSSTELDRQASVRHVACLNVKKPPLEPASESRRQSCVRARKAGCFTGALNGQSVLEFRKLGRGKTDMGSIHFVPTFVRSYAAETSQYEQGTWKDFVLFGSSLESMFQIHAWNQES